MGRTRTHRARDSRRERLRACLRPINPAVLILSGPPGAGKTTVARPLASRYDRAVHLESDYFFEVITSGYIEPWKPESNEQNHIVMEIIGDAAAGYAVAGYLTILDGIPGWFFEPLRDTLHARGVAVSYAVLRPPLDVCIERSRTRHRSRLSDPSVIEQLWSSFADLGPLERHVIDTDDRNAEGTAVSIDALLRRGSLSALA